MGANNRWKIVWITGASTGIGRELALHLARQGSIVAVSARSTEKLSEMHALDARIRPYPLDVGDPVRVEQVFAQIENDLGPVDLAVLNAGIWHMMNVRDFSAARAAESMQVNYVGVVNAMEHVMRSMTARRAGQIGIVSSVAGYRGLLNGAAYAPTKSALINLCECLHEPLKLKGVKLSVINPGFVKTPMTDVNTFPMPFIIPVEEAVEEIISGLTKRKFEIVFPWQMKIMMKTLRYMPNAMFFWMIRRMAEQAGRTGNNG